MIYITGDTHGERARLQPAPGKDDWTADDVLIVCGDFGFIFDDNAEENSFLDETEKRPFTLCFVDGNHENFAAIGRYPVEEWNGGKAHRIRNNVFHLMRGQFFTIQGYSFFTFGGGYSIDRYMRRKNVSYWDEELPSDAEYKEAIAALRAHDMKADYILTHTAPKEMALRMGYNPDPHEWQLEGFLEWIMYEAEYKHWYCGHWHQDMEMSDKFTVLYFDTVCIQ